MTGSARWPNPLIASPDWPRRCADLGVQPGDRVGILALNSDRYLEYFYAVPWMGAAVNPVNIRWSAAEIAYSLADSDTRVLFVDDAFAPMIPTLQEQFPDLRAVIYCGDGELPAGALGYETLIAEHDPVEDTRTGGNELLGVFYTGGTTGHPKGVMLSHNNVLTSSIGSLASGHFITPARPVTAHRAAVSSRRHRGMGRGMSGRLHARDRAGVQSGRGVEGDRRARTSPTPCWCRQWSRCSSTTRPSATTTCRACCI